MKRSALVLLSAILLLSISSAAFAFPGLELVADCYGWSIDGTGYFGPSTHIDIEYTVDLMQDGSVVYTANEVIVLYPGDDPHFFFEGTWDMELCGDYTAVITFYYSSYFGSETGTYEVPFTCECEIETCTYTPGFWKNHEEAWNVEGLTVGCVDYPTNDELLDIFDWPTQGDITIILFHHLVAAKLNVLNGSDDYIMSYITAGDDFLCMHPLGSSPEGSLKDDAEMIKDALAAYNEIECEEEEEAEMLKIDGPAPIDKAAAATEESSWGSIKRKHQ